MTEEQKELFFDLLVKKAVHGLDEAEENQLAEFDRDAFDAEFHSLEMTAAAIGLAGVGETEPMPEHLRARILKNAPVGATSRKVPLAEIYDSTAVFREKRSNWFGWLGWAVAAAACFALGLNIWFTRMQPIEQAKIAAPPQTQQVLTERQKYEELMASSGVIKAKWTPGNVEETKYVTGDLVWSEEKQIGYMRLQGLPIKGAPSFCYQLWIFDKVQDKATPIDGGTFEVTTEGEIIVPITAKLRTNGAQMFAITIERHGGVVVSKREKIAALAKVEGQPS